MDAPAAATEQKETVQRTDEQEVADAMRAMSIPAVSLAPKGNAAEPATAAVPVTTVSEPVAPAPASDQLHAFGELRASASRAFDEEDMVVALDLWTKCLSMANQVKELSVADRSNCAVSLGRVYASSVHHVPDFVRCFDAAVTVASEANDLEQVVTVLTTLGRTLYRAGKPDMALTQARRILARVQCCLLTAKEQFQNALRLAGDIQSPKPGTSHHGCYYVPALLEFGRISLQMNVEGAAEKANKALHEAVDGAVAYFGANSPQHCLALAGLGEAKKAAGDIDGAIADMEAALAPQCLPDLDAARILTHLGTAYSEKEGSPRTLECYEKAVQVRSRCFANGARHFLVAEIQLDIAAEHWEAKRFGKAMMALESAIPYLSLPEKAMEVQWSWLRKCYEQAGMSLEEASERYRGMKTLRKQVERTRRRLPVPAKSKESSFLPEEPAKKSSKPKQKGKNKKK